MNQQQTLITPARQYELVPQVPSPQTVSGRLEHSGVDDDNEPITDIPPDFGWMATMPMYVQRFTWPSGEIIIELDRFATPVDASGQNFPWLAVPMSYNRYFNGELQLRFLAIKPSRTTGKILFTYQPSTKPVRGQDVRQRLIKKEWDLAETTSFEMTIPGYNPNRMRTTTQNRADPVPGYIGYKIRLPPASFSFGSLHMSEAIPYTPGSIFPDSFTIILEMSLQKAEFATPCDSHGQKGDFFNPDAI